jgi:hypothetical protein
MVVEQDYLLTGKLPAVRARAGETEADALHRVQWGTETARRAWRRTAGSRRRCCGAMWTSSRLQPEIFHQKFVIRDYRGDARPTSGLLSGSANFTVTDCHQNLNHVVIFHDVAVCKEYAGEFASIRAGRFGRGEHGDVPKCHNINGIPVKVLFAPDHTPELEIMKQMLKATDRVDFAIFTFSGSSGIDDTMVALQQAGRHVRGAVDPGQGVQVWAATHDLDRAGIEIFFPDRTPPFRKLHHKLMVIDEATWWPARSTTPPPRTSTTTRTSSCSAARSWTSSGRGRAGRPGPAAPRSRGTPDRDRPHRGRRHPVRRRARLNHKRAEPRNEDWHSRRRPRAGQTG